MIAATMRLEATDVCLNLMPLFHIHGLSVNVLATMLAGASVICSPGMGAGGLTATQVVEGLNREPRPTWLSAVPTMHQLILQRAEQLVAGGARIRHSLHTIRNCSAALLPAISERIERVFEGSLVLPTYAMTECVS